MGHRCCNKQKVKRGLWSPEEDDKLLTHITTHGHGSWSSVPKLAGSVSFALSVKISDFKVYIIFSYIVRCIIFSICIYIFQ